MGHLVLVRLKTLSEIAKEFSVTQPIGIEHSSWYAPSEPCHINGARDAGGSERNGTGSPYPHDGSGHVCGAINNSGHRNQLGSAEDLIKQVCHCAAQYQIAVMQVAASQFADVFRHRDRLHMRPELVW